MTDITSAFMSASLGRYEVRERLGTGGMARVFKGYDTNLDRVVAIKILHEHLADEPTFKDRFEREAKLVGSLNHPHIVQMYDYNTIYRGGQSIYYMVMSYLPGPTLREVMSEISAKGDHLSHERVLQIMLILLEALGYAHDRGMIHRDVKPANILMNERNDPVLTDFGIARLVEGSSLTQEGLTVGTPAYMSPEQATGEMVDGRTDLYALGIILYELLAGKPPFDDDGSISVLLKHLNEPVPSLSKFTRIDNPYLDTVIYKALAKRREDRYQTASEFAEDIKMAFAGQMPNIGELTPLSTHAVAAQSNPKIQAISPQPIGQSQVPARSPLVILAIGMGVIMVMLFGALVLQQGDNNNANALPQSVEGMTGDSMTGNLFFASQFSGDEPFLAGWPQDEMNGLIREVTPDGFYRIRSQMADRAVATIFLQAGNYDDLAIQITAQLDSQSAAASGYGIIFNYVDNDNYNVFAVDGLGRFSIWVRETGQWRELRGESEQWTPNPAINPAGEMNTLTVSVMGNQLTGMVNG
ncbi:MAG: serine/threonine protein kinase, partial [Chitinophagaceae bacterium]|nr:serine/threonine protein kinase [Anaerolineae bacterium]